jgi:hypothetical protein
MSLDFITATVTFTHTFHFCKCSLLLTTCFDWSGHHQVLKLCRIYNFNCVYSQFPASLLLEILVAPVHCLRILLKADVETSLDCLRF